MGVWGWLGVELGDGGTNSCVDSAREGNVKKIEIQESSERKK